MALTLPWAALEEQAEAAVSLRWLTGHGPLQALAGQAPDLAKAAFGSPASFCLNGNMHSASPAPTGVGASPVLNCKSFAKFAADVAAGGISRAYRWVLYDPEHWPETPVGEQNDPWRYLRLFGQLARASGYRVMAAPARNLGNAPGSVRPKYPDESVTDWYLRTGLAAAAAQYADIVEVQAQRIEADLATYTRMVNTAKNQIAKANPYAAVFAGVTTDTGTAAQMASAAKAVQVAGYWLNIIDGATAKAISFLRLMGY